MHLTIAVPEKLLVRTEAAKITADGVDGSFCLLPNHIDYATALAVGIVSYVDPEGVEHFVAVDRGILIKCGDEVSISVRRAIRGAPLEELEEAVLGRYRERSREEQEARRASAQLQASFVQRFLDLEESRP